MGIGRPQGKGIVLTLAALGLATWAGYRAYYRDLASGDRSPAGGLLGGRAPANLFSKPEIARAADIEEFPEQLEVQREGDTTKIPLVAQYTIDRDLQTHLEGLFKLHRPKHGAFVALEPDTGKILALVSYTSDRRHADGNLALRATFPSASVFKVVTAAAAIAENRFSADTVIPFNGRNHTLYRSNILKTQFTRWTRYMTLRDAFAKSVNTVFGKIGAFTIGPDRLRTYAERFGFNRPIPADVMVQQGQAPIPSDPWELAETASGFTRDNTMSPLQGALIAATIANGGRMMEPYVVESLHALDGTPAYHAETKLIEQSVDPDTASEIKSLMRETVRKGTSRSAFRGVFRGNLASLDAGGKTGSLTGMDPPGKYDWFVGYGDLRGKRIAMAVLTIHGAYWTVKSSYLARRALERYYAQ